MKANHIPAADRLERRLWKLEILLDTFWETRRGRFYPYCRHCGLDRISVNMYGHSKGCRIRGVDKQIVHYQKLRLEALGKAST